MRNKRRDTQITNANAEPRTTPIRLPPEREAVEDGAPVSEGEGLTVVVGEEGMVDRLLAVDNCVVSI